MAKKTKINFEDLIQDSVSNIKEDRATAHQLLDHLRLLIDQFPGQAEIHAQVGTIASKYLEAVQRGNEQLVKIAGIMAKTSPEPEEMTKDQIYDLLQAQPEEVEEIKKEFDYALLEKEENDGREM